MREIVVNKSKMQLKKILLIEDDLNVCAFVKKGLSEEGFEVEVANDGDQGIDLFTKNRHDLILLDIMLPTISGLEVCSKIRAFSQVPIILLTALGTAENVALGLNTGADDYLVKPFKFIELTARIKSILRRTEFPSSTEKNELIYNYSTISLNDSTKTVVRDNIEISLTSTEFNLLKMFLQNPRRVLSRIEILEKVWGVDFDLGTNVVDVYVNYLRKKIDNDAESKLIHTVIGMGYVMKEA